MEYLLTTTCITLLLLNLLTFPVAAFWSWLMPQFRDLPKHLQRHDVNWLLRGMVAPLVGIAILFLTLKTFQDCQWWMDNRGLVSSCVLVFLLLDLFELSQRRKFDWQPYVHHTCQTIVALFFLEWGQEEAYNQSFPLLGLAIFSAFSKPADWFFAFSHVAPERDILLMALCSLVWSVLWIGVGCAVMVALMINCYERLSPGYLIVHPVMYVLFQLFDLPLHFTLCQRAFQNKKKIDETDATDNNPSGDSSETSFEV